MKTVLQRGTRWSGDEGGDVGEFVGVEASFGFEVVVDLDVDPEAVVDAEGFR